MGDRIYRFLVPGTIFLCAYCGLLILYPGLSFLGILKVLCLPGIGGIPVAAFASGILLVVIGYTCSTLTHPMVIRHTFDSPLASKGFERVAGKMSIPNAEHAQRRDLFAVYVHGYLNEAAPGLTQYLLLAWSHIVTLCKSLVALVLAVLAFLLTSILVPVWAKMAHQSLLNCRDWYNPNGLSHGELLVWLVSITAAYAVAVLITWFLAKRALRESIRHYFDIVEFSADSSLMDRKKNAKGD